MHPLGLERAPPPSAPLRFFLSAPLFLVLAGLLLAVLGEEALRSRWAPATLALVHLITAGFMLQVMLGALFQFLPVAIGAAVADPRRLAALVHPPVTVGALLLVVALYTGTPWVAALAAAALAGGLAVYLAAAGAVLWRRPSTSPTATAVKLALACLAVAAALGLGLLLFRSFGNGLRAVYTDVHAAWGVIGWGGLLIAGVAYVVVPMFQLTPAYPATFARRFAPLVLAVLLAWSLATLAGVVTAALPAGALLVLLAAGFAVLTLSLQQRSKRPRADVTVRYWRLGLVAILVAASGALARLAGAEGSPAATLLGGVLVLAGFFVALMSGMLCKIVPFLCWLHAQSLARSRGQRAPHMGSFLDERAARAQFWLYALALGCLAAATSFPDALARPAGMLTMGAALLLWRNLALAVLRYRRFAAGDPALAP